MSLAMQNFSAVTGPLKQAYFQTAKSVLFYLKLCRIPWPRVEVWSFDVYCMMDTGPQGLVVPRNERIHSVQCDLAP